jgi:Diacylglycerol acyltransferase
VFVCLPRFTRSGASDACLQLLHWAASTSAHISKQPGAEEAVALLREQLRLREAELATLQSARPGICARCADVALAVSAHPSFRPSAPVPKSSVRGALSHAAALRASLVWTLGVVAGCLACTFVWLELLDVAAIPLLATAAWLAAGVPARSFAAPADAAARATLLVMFALSTFVGALLLAPRVPARVAALVAYIAWYTTVDSAPARGDRAWPSLRRLSIWRGLAQGLGVSLHKTGDLDPAASHVIAYSPVGHISAASVLAFGAPGAAGWATSFPGVDTRIAAPPTGCGALVTPLLREGLLAMGVVDGSEAAMVGVLAEATAHTHDGTSPHDSPGFALVAPVPVAGGATGIISPPGAYDAATAARKRLARVALRTGAFLVPAFGFGDAHDAELSAVEQATPTMIGTVTAAMRRTLGIQLPLVPGALAPVAAFLSRHVMSKLDDSTPPAKALSVIINALQYRGVGQSARRARIVVGRPIACARVSNPSDALVDDVAFKLWRETAQLAAAHMLPAEEGGDNAPARD